MISSSLLSSIHTRARHGSSAQAAFRATSAERSVAVAVELLTRRRALQRAIGIWRHLSITSLRKQLQRAVNEARKADEMVVELEAEARAARESLEHAHTAAEGQRHSLMQHLHQVEAEQSASQAELFYVKGRARSSREV